MKLKKSWRNCKGLVRDRKGSFTVEAAIIIPAVILTMFALILVSEFCTKNHVYRLLRTGRRSVVLKFGTLRPKT